MVIKFSPWAICYLDKLLSPFESQLKNSLSFKAFTNPTEFNSTYIHWAPSIYLALSLDLRTQCWIEFYLAWSRHQFFSEPSNGSYNISHKEVKILPFLPSGSGMFLLSSPCPSLRWPQPHWFPAVSMTLQAFSSFRVFDFATSSAQVFLPPASYIHIVWPLSSTVSLPKYTFLVGTSLNKNIKHIK